MNYEIVSIHEKALVGISERSNKQSSNMKLWGTFYQKYYSKINGICNEKVYGVYNNFTLDGCNSVIACECMPNIEQPEGVDAVIIPEGKYAKFTIVGEVHEVVPRFWEELDKIRLDRAYICDYEEFPNSLTENVTINIYISIKA